MVPRNYSKFDQVSVSIAGRVLLTSFVSNVPGLKVTTKRKKHMSSKSADHSSIQPPAYERIKAQLERWKKQQKVPQPQPDHSEKPERNHDVRAQGSRILYKGPTDEEKAAAAAAVAERMRRKCREGGAAEKEKRRREKEDEDAEMEMEDLDEVLDNFEMGLDEAVQDWFGNTNGGYEDRGQEEVGSAQHPKERQEKLASQKMSQRKPVPSEESLTESESDVSIQPPPSPPLQNIMNDIPLFKKRKLPEKIKPTKSVMTNTTSVAGSPRRSQRTRTYTEKYKSGF